MKTVAVVGAGGRRSGRSFSLALSLALLGASLGSAGPIPVAPVPEPVQVPKPGRITFGLPESRAARRKRLSAMGLKSFASKF